MLSLMLSLMLALGCSRPACPEGMVLLPAAELRLGQDPPTASWHEAGRTVTLPAFCMDVYEHPNREGELPTYDVSWDEAAGLCAATGKRLCSSDEWERACRGPEGRRYAYGQERDPERCNTPLEEGGFDQERGAPHLSLGSKPGCVSPEGVRDLNGSVSEWVADPWSDFPEHYNAGAKVDPATWRTLRGGTMWKKTFYGQDCTSRHGHERRSRNMDDGLRCCAATI